MRKPRDIDSELKALEAKAKTLKERRVRQLGELVIATGADALDADLLAGTPVRFVGSATIGTDHIDTGWLRQAGIAFAHAPGCNAMAVAEYALQAVLDWVIGRGRPLAGMRIGVLGCGNVGSRPHKGVDGCAVGHRPGVACFGLRRQSLARARLHHAVSRQPKND